MRAGDLGPYYAVYDPCIRIPLGQGSAPAG